MKKFTLTIKLGNEEMQTPLDVKQVLQSVADDMDVVMICDEDEWSLESGTIRDINGNKVGGWYAE